MGEGAGGGEPLQFSPLNPLPPRERSFMVMKGGKEMAIEESNLLEFTGSE